MTGAPFAVEQRSGQPQRGQFIVGGSPSPAHVVKRAQLPLEFVEFEAAAREADRLATLPGLDEIRQRLTHANEMLSKLRAAARRR